MLVDTDFERGDIITIKRGWCLTMNNEYSTLNENKFCGLDWGM